jgi:Na+-translocating ferredoxin:NAD+ oxidoreductase RnfG subunit
MTRGRIDWLLAPVAVLVAAAPAHAAVYLSVEQALRQAFPDADEFVPRPVRLDPGQWQAIGRETPAPVASREPRGWSATAGGHELGRVYVDEVLGKQLFIQYAVAIGIDATIRRVEILAYRETHGFEVRNSRWLAQFRGKGTASTLAVGRDIQNISGATLSCRHVTEGVRRLLAIDEAQSAVR